MKYRLKKAVVLGSGVMGSGIACHLANVGMEVLMLDILPSNKKQVVLNNIGLYRAPLINWFILNTKF